jgi:hypothetical protein
MDTCLTVFTYPHDLDDENEAEGVGDRAINTEDVKVERLETRQIPALRIDRMNIDSMQIKMGRTLQNL